MHKISTSIFHGAGAVLTSLLSCSACPACLPIYAGLLSLLGIELFEINMYFFPLMLCSIGLTLSLMARQVFFRNADFRPLLMSSVAASIIIWGVVEGYELALYLSLAVFMGSIFWNKSLVKKTSCKDSCNSKCSSHA